VAGPVFYPATIAHIPRLELRLETATVRALPVAGSLPLVYAVALAIRHILCLLVAPPPTAGVIVEVAVAHH
jgi:hypothetical protein